MRGERLQVRLNPDRRRKLSELAAAEGLSMSDTVRRMIDRANEDALREKRRRAAKAIARLGVEDVPDPETLSRQLAGTYDLLETAEE